MILLSWGDAVAEKRTLAVGDLIEDRPIRGEQYVAFGLICLLALLDGLFTQIVTFVGKSIASDWHITMLMLGSVFSMGLIGVMIGSLTLGALGDVLGQKRVLVAVTVLVGCVTFATGFVHSIEPLMALRFFTGLAVGGSLPNAIALAAQLTPKRRRATVIALIGSSVPAGAVLGGVLAGWITPRFGWHATFMASGVIPLLITPFVLWRLPESVTALLKRAKGQEKVRKFVARLDPGVDLTDAWLVWTNASVGDKFPIAQLFRGGFAKFSILLPAVFFMNLLEVYLLTNWLPTLVQNSHGTLSQAVTVTIAFNLAGIAAALSLGRCADAFGWARVLFATFLLAAGAAWVLSISTASVRSLTIASIFTGFFMVGGQALLNAVPALLYPGQADSAATGWALGIGRLGSITGPFLAGVLLDAHWTVAHVIRLSGLPAIFSAILILIISLLWKKHRKNASRAELNPRSLHARDQEA